MENETNDGGMDPVLSFVGMNNLYKDGKLMYIAGKEDATPGDVGTLCRPVQAQGVDIDPANDGDVILLSYVYTKGGKKYLRQLMVKLNSFAGAAARFSVLVPSADGNWVAQTEDVTLVDRNDTTPLVNPHTLAQYGNYLYLPDYQNAKISIVNAGDLEAAADGTAIPVSTFNLNPLWNPKPAYTPRGQAVIILDQFLYALGIDANDLATAFSPSHLFRLAIDSVTGALAYDTQAEVGINAQSIIPVNDGTAVQLFIPAIGGRQFYTGDTNDTDSNISYVPAVGAWPDPSVGAAPVAVTGDPATTPATAYDIHAVAAAMRNGTSALFILTQLYNNNGRTALWRIYRTTVADFLTIGGITLSAAVTAGKLTVVDEGTIASPSSVSIPYGLYFWDMLYEQIPDTDSDDGDRVWVGKGTPILATRAAAYGSPTGTSQNAYIEYGYLGGVNVNAGAFDLLIETLNQARRGVSLKRTFRKAQAPKPQEEKEEDGKAKSK